MADKGRELGDPTSLLSRTGNFKIKFANTPCWHRSHPVLAQESPGVKYGIWHGF